MSVANFRSTMYDATQTVRGQGVWTQRDNRLRCPPSNHSSRKSRERKKWGHTTQDQWDSAYMQGADRGQQHNQKEGSKVQKEGLEVMEFSCITNTWRQATVKLDVHIYHSWGR